jgi:hypothetical protein
MASTRNIMSSALWSLPFLGYQPVNISNGDPAVNAANLVKQVILGPPFSWAWNRTDFEIEEVSADNGRDYIIEPIKSFGFLEKAWLIDAKDNVIEIKVVLALSEEGRKQRPSSIATQFIDTDGTVLLRFNTIPDQAYTLRGFYQNAPDYMTSQASLWSPIPDHLSYIYDWGYLAILAMLTKDQRVPLFGQRFISHLLGAQDGLSATQRNIFIGNWLDLITEPGRAQTAMQQAVAARGAQ